ncbi:MAG: hypothetical protein GY835_11435 [bacterium]|nr:hypothetical protein [bacterium]
MDIVASLSFGSRILLYVLLAAIAFFTGVVTWAQVGCIRGRFFQNPDGTTDDWREQKIFYGIAWADLLLACPTSTAALVLIFAAPRWGFFLMGMVSFWFLWTNVMTTVTSLRFEKPKLTLAWLVVFPLGAVIGLSFIVWTFVNFHVLFGA